MRSHEPLLSRLAAAVLWCLAGCSGSLTVGLMNGDTGSTGGATSAAAGASSTGAGHETSSTTGSATTGARAGSSSSTGRASTGASSGTTGTATGGATTGAISCGPNAVCIDQTCVVIDQSDAGTMSDGGGMAAECAGAAIDEGCALPDGGTGFCEDSVCWVPSGELKYSTCDTLGASCPSGSHCTGAFSGCQTDAGVSLSTCDQLDCPAGTACGDTSLFGSLACLITDCEPGHDYDICSPAGGQKFIDGILDVQVCCGAVCADMGADPAHCGGCGVACGPGKVCIAPVSEPYQGSCYAASCDGQPEGSDCGLDGGVGACCGGSCVDLRSDLANCGVCGLACPSEAGYVCYGGTECLLFDDGGLEVSCGDPSTPCPSGWTCLGDFACEPDCSSAPEGTQCGVSFASYELIDGYKYVNFPDSCCATQCADLGIDPANCGACGRACPPGEACNGGTCQQTDCTKAGGGFTPCVLPSGRGGQCCGGVCSDHLSDDSNCFSCGQVCPSGSSCHGGACVLAAFPDSGLPQCVSLGCPPNSVCLGPDSPFACVKTACGPNDDGLDCAVDGGLTSEGGPGTCCGERCVDRDTDSQNCGLCGVSCGEATTCQGQSCAPYPNPGCGGDAGLCAAGLTCVPQLGCLSTSCSGLVNGDRCLFGIDPGNLYLINGLEETIGICCGQQCVDPYQDPANFGGCGMSAPSSAATGCSVCIDFSSNFQNCGQCGFACQPGQACVGGSCTGSADPPPICAGRNGAFCDPDAGLGSTGQLLQCCLGLGCHDVSDDSQNCGACGYACPAATSCHLGVCG